MHSSRRFIDFNKQLLVGELGAVAGTALGPWVVSHLTVDPDLLSLAAVVGGLVTSSLGWLGMWAWDEHRRGGATLEALAQHVAYYTPAAVILGLAAYQPTLYFVTRHFILAGHSETTAALLGQTAAFCLFGGVINAYRFALGRFARKSL